MATRRKGKGARLVRSREWYEGYGAAIRSVLEAAKNGARFGLLTSRQTQRSRLKAAVYKFTSEFDRRGVIQRGRGVTRGKGVSSAELKDAFNSKLGRSLTRLRRGLSSTLDKDRAGSDFQAGPAPPMTVTLDRPTQPRRAVLVALSGPRRNLSINVH